MTTITGIEFMTLPVSDPAASLAFYGRFPGAKIRDGQVGFGTNALAFRRAAPPPPRDAWTGAEFRFEAAGAVGNFLAFLKSADIPLCAGPVLRDGPAGEGAGILFRDPDGTLVEVVVRAPERESAPDKFTISTATRPEELATVALLAAEIWPAVYRDLLPPGQIAYMLEKMYAPEVVTAEIQRGCEFILLKKGETAGGFSAYGPVDPDSGDCELHKIYLAPGCRQRGFGRKIIRRAADWARERGARRLTLHVNKNNAPAIRAYLRCGMKSAASVVSDIGHGFVMDDYIMVLDLQEWTPQENER